MNTTEKRINGKYCDIKISSAYTYSIEELSIIINDEMKVVEPCMSKGFSNTIFDADGNVITVFMYSIQKMDGNRPTINVLYMYNDVKDEEITISLLERLYENAKVIEPSHSTVIIGKTSTLSEDYGCQGDYIIRVKNGYVWTNYFGK